MQNHVVVQRSTGYVGFGVVPSRPIDTTTGAYLSAGGTWVNASSMTVVSNILMLVLPIHGWLVFSMEQ